MNNPKRQHIIPRMHLQHFVDANAGGRIWNYEKQTGEIRAAAIEDTAVESHFYSGQLADGSMDFGIEQTISQIEDAAASVYQALLAGEVPNDPQQRYNFGHFLGLMVARTRALRRMAGESYSRFRQIKLYITAQDPRAFAAHIQRYEQHLGRTLPESDREEIREVMLDPSAFEFTVAKEKTFAVLPAADHLAPMFAKMNWWLMDASGGYFITSDNPVVREVDPTTRHAIYGDHGYANKTVEVTFPLAPHRLLMMTWSEKERVKTLSADDVRLANMARAAHSDLYLYANTNSAEVAAMAAQFRDSRPTMKTEGAGPEKFGTMKVSRRTPR